MFSWTVQQNFVLEIFITFTRNAIGKIKLKNESQWVRMHPCVEKQKFKRTHWLDTVLFNLYYYF